MEVDLKLQQRDPHFQMLLARKYDVEATAFNDIDGSLSTVVIPLSVIIDINVYYMFNRSLCKPLYSTPSSTNSSR